MTVTPKDRVRMHLALAKIERDTLVSGLTDDEIDGLILASRPSPVGRDEVLEVVAQRKMVYQGKLDTATEGEWSASDYTRCELLQHTIEAFEFLEADIGTLKSQPSSTGGE